MIGSLQWKKNSICTPEMMSKHLFTSLKIRTSLEKDRFFAPIARLIATRIVFAFVAHKNIKLSQMVKNDFLNGFIEEEVYVKNTSWF